MIKLEDSGEILEITNLHLVFLAIGKIIEDFRKDFMECSYLHVFKGLVVLKNVYFSVV